MADRAALLALAARVEAAAEGSEELDLAVHAVAFHEVIGGRQTYTPWTRDLNAALALVGGWDWALDVLDGVPAAEVYPEGVGVQTYSCVRAATPALALTAAALRARAAEEG